MTSQRPPENDPAAPVDPYVARELATHGFVRPPWQYDGDEHPFSLFWRMGGGESQLMAFWAWWQGLRPDEEERVAWVRRWEPPALWWPWAAGLIWPELEDDGDDDEDRRQTAAVERLAGIGIGSVSAWQAAEQRAMVELEAQIARQEAEDRERAAAEDDEGE